MGRCKTHASLVCWRCFWITVSFPAEHFIWEKLPYFRAITTAIGL